MFLSLFFSFLLFLFSFCFCLQYVNFPNANLLVFLFPGFIVIPKPSQLSQWNSSIATIFLLLKKPCNPESDAALHPASIASFPLLWYPSPLSPSPPRPAPPCLALPWPDLFCFFSLLFFDGFSVLCVSHSLGLVEEWSKSRCGAIVISFFCAHVLRLSGVLIHFRVLKKKSVWYQVRSDCCPPPPLSG